MEKTALTHRGKVRIILYISTVILVLSIFGIVQSVKASRLERQVIIHNQFSLISLDENLNSISTNLEKVMYSGSPAMLSRLASELWREASGAKTNLSMLPLDDSQLNGTYKLLSQVGEFVMALGRKAANGEELSKAERENLEKLYKHCNDLSEHITGLCYELENGTLLFEKVDSTLLEANSSSTSIYGSFDDVEQSMSDMPSLIYDGPFSDHLEGDEPIYLKGLDEINKDKALEVAKEVCEKEKNSLEYSHDEDGDIPCYIFKGESCVVAITKKGGVPLYMISSDFVGEIEIKEDEAVRNAKKFLDKIGFEKMVETYYFTDNGNCTINFAYEQNGVVVYSDLIKVSVSLESGEILSFDASGYVFNHRVRDINTPAISEAEAIKGLNDSLEVIATQSSIIPTEWKTEQFCYEIHCKAKNGQELLVYVDCDTGEENNILILLYSDDGVLTK